MTQQAILPASSEPVDIHEALNQVRHLPEFQTTPSDQTWDKLQHHPWVHRFLERLQETLDRLVEAMAQLFSGVKPPSAFGHDALLEQIFRGTLFFLIFFGVLVLLYFLLVFLRRCLEQLPRAKDKSALLIEGLAIQDRAFHEHQARVMAEKGEYSQAVCQVYLAVLCLLDETGQAPLEPSRSNLEYWLFLRRHHLEALSGDFKQIAMAFEGVRFGKRQPSLEDYDQCRLRYEGIRRDSNPLKRKAYV